jgi:hypothetical protein
MSSTCTGVSVAEFRGTFGLVYRVEGLTLNLQAQYVLSIINDNVADFAPNAGKNANIGRCKWVLAPCRKLCCSARDSIVDVPAGAGSAQYANTITAGGQRGFCAAQNTATLAVDVAEAWANVDLIYRVELPAESSMTLSINNLPREAGVLCLMSFDKLPYCP